MFEGTVFISYVIIIVILTMWLLFLKVLSPDMVVSQLSTAIKLYLQHAVDVDVNTKQVCIDTSRHLTGMY